MNQLIYGQHLRAIRAGNSKSLAAHARVEPTAQHTGSQIIALATQRGYHGITADEVTAPWGCSPNHVAPRITELKKSGLLVRTNRTRPTQTGSPARVLVATQFANIPEERLFPDDAPLRHLDLG